MLGNGVIPQSQEPEPEPVIGRPPLPMLPGDARPRGDAAGVCEGGVGGRSEMSIGRPRKGS